MPIYKNRPQKHLRAAKIKIILLLLLPQLLLQLLQQLQLLPQQAQ